MKKIYAMMAILATVCAVSCNKGGSDDPVKPENKEKYVAPIEIDGQFEDWAKLDATKIASAQCDPDATKTALKLVKVYADKEFIYVYFEWDKDQIAFSADENVPFHMYINCDGKTDTGGYGDQWSDACIDAMTEGALYPSGVIGSYDAGVYKWYGDVNGTGWKWGPQEGVDEPILAAGSGLFKGAGVEGKYELYIIRGLFPINIADNFSIGFDIQQNWDSVGVLPNGHVDEVEGSTGLVPTLSVVAVK